MRALRISSTDGPDAMRVDELAPPTVGHGEVLIEVRAAGISFPEVLQTRGKYQIKPELPFTPGGEASGLIMRAPHGSGFEPGDRVAAYTTIGAIAEQVAAPTHLTLPLPDELTFEEGAGTLLNYCTAHFALLERGNLEAGQSVLVHGASGGLGTAMIQVAKAFGAERIVAVTSTSAKGEMALLAGADEFVLAAGFKDGVLANGHVDIVVDIVGGDRFTDSLRCLAEGGCLLVVGFAGGSIPAVKVNRLLLNNISVIGVGWGHYALQKPDYVRSQWEDLLPYIRTRKLKPMIGKVVDLDHAVDGFAAVEQRQALGKVVVTLEQERLLDSKR